MKTLTDIHIYDGVDDTIIRWHVTDEGEIDYTIYTVADGGRIALPQITTIENIEKLLEEQL